MNNIPLAQDLALKRTVHAPLEQKPVYAWRDVLAAGEISLPPIILLCPHGEERFDMTEVADTLGKAFTNVCISQGEMEIFTDKNRAWVAQICRELGGNLTEIAWRDVLAAGEISLPPIILLCPHGEERFDMTEVADTLGKAFTNVCISQGEMETFVNKNRAWVAQICRELGGNLTEMARKQNPLRLTLNGLYELIEKTLVDNNAYM